MNVGESSAKGISNDIPATGVTLVSAGMPFDVGAGESYHFLYTLSNTSTNLAGFDHCIVAPGCTGSYINTSSTSASIGDNAGTTGLAVNTRYGKTGNFNDTHSNTISGILVNGGAATTCDLQFAKHAAVGVDTVTNGGSSVLYTRIA